MSGAEPRELTDIHNHLVPGVDDGARTTEESLRHLNALHAEGVRRLAVSPHLNGWIAREPGALAERLAELRRAFDALAAVCGDRDGVPELRFGQEILLPAPELAGPVFGENGVGIDGTRYALIELGFHLEGDAATAAVRASLEAGRRTIVAHPERYVRGGEPVALDEIRGWKQAGALLQVNGGSLIGRYGDGITRQAWRLLAEGLADVVASDHHADFGPTSPAQVARALAGRGAAVQARLLLSENPARILADEPTEAVPPLAQSVAA